MMLSDEEAPEDVAADISPGGDRALAIALILGFVAVAAAALMVLIASVTVQPWTGVLTLAALAVMLWAPAAWAIIGNRRDRPTNPQDIDRETKETP